MIAEQGHIQSASQLRSKHELRGGHSIQDVTVVVQVDPIPAPIGRPGPEFQLNIYMPVLFGLQVHRHFLRQAQEISSVGNGKNVFPGGMVNFAQPLTSRSVK